MGISENAASGLNHSPREYVDAYWNPLTGINDALSLPVPNKETADNLANVLDGSWEALVRQFDCLSRRQRLEYRHRLARNLPFQAMVLPFREILELKAERWTELYNARENRPFNQYMSQTQGRIAVMTSGNVRGYGLLPEVMNLTYIDGSIRSEASSLWLVMLAFNASLPWNRTGFNRITLAQIKPEIAREAREYIESRLLQFQEDEV
jgi:hypothetical protein